MNRILMGYARLARPANLPTAAADILVGIAIAVYFVSLEISVFLADISIDVLNLVCASVLLYAGGVVLNDVFDRKLDMVERPERPIPSGLIPYKSAATFGIVLLLAGIFFGFMVGATSGALAAILAISILGYDAYAKKHGLFGPMIMGLCRALNLVLGMSLFQEIGHWWYGMIPFCYIFAITLISRGEVHGNNRNHLIWSAILYGLVILMVIIITGRETGKFLEIIPFLMLFSFLIYRPLIRAYRSNVPSNIKKAVMAGVLSIIVLDASLAVGFSVWWYGLLILLLLPVSMLLARLFAVT